MTVTQERPATDARNLISAELRATLVSNTRAKFPELADGTADRGIGQMLAFLAAGAHSDAPLSPSPLVDDFWHAFLLHTQAYQDFCTGTIGTFVHHQPGFLDKEKHGGGKALRARTVEAIVAAGFMIDMEFWPELDLADCSQCHANCHNSPKYA
ncbi:glycine-rich domain-containing protein [Streptomyces sp. NPDC087420]|uniref:glycine-rich domain-containing protein n=1 Tax=Streptomyces sp. NPDC087420 TaxID=3365785 RepID=UPI0038357F57